MKRVFLFFTLTAYCLFAQNTNSIVDSLNSAKTDSFDLHLFVQQQIDAARKKALEPVVEKPASAEKIVIPKTVPQQQKASVNPAFELFMKLPWQYKVFIPFSAIIILFVFFKRIFVLTGRKSLKKLKRNISLLREEKAVSFKRDPKVDKTRRELTNNNLIFNNSERQISKNAKQLNIAKGELLLAARLRLFQVGKM